MIANTDLHSRLFGAGPVTLMLAFAPGAHAQTFLGELPADWTWALVLAGLAAMLFMGRRRQRD